MTRLYPTCPFSTLPVWVTERPKILYTIPTGNHYVSVFVSPTASRSKVKHYKNRIKVLCKTTE